MRLRIDTNKNGTQNYYVMESFRTDNKKSTTRIVKKLGSYDQLIKEHEDPEAWAREVVAEMNRQAQEGKQKVMVPYLPSELIEKDKTMLFDGGYLFLQKLFYRLHLDYICKQITKRHDFSYNLTEILAHLVCARVLNPASKLASYEYAQSFLEKPTYDLKDMYRALEVIGEEKDYIQSMLYKFSKDLGKRNDKILYYDCTNYYFEIERERGMAKYGPSKEHRPNPIIEMGLFMDGDGIPLAFCLHDGNTNEQKTLQPLEHQIIRDFGSAQFIVCTDAGLSSVSNRKFNNVAGRAFITAQSIKKMKDYQKDWALSPEGWRLPGSNAAFNLNDILGSEKKTEKYWLHTFYKEQWLNDNNIEQRYIVTFSLKYMNYQRTIRNEQINRAEKAISSETKTERCRQSDYKRFITRTSVTDNGEVAEKKIYTLNEAKIADEEQYDGFYCVATNLEDEAAEIIRVNHRRWEIEESFRIMKTEFSARPVYLSRDDRITAHFTTCFLALVLYRYFEKSLTHKYTCPQLLEQLKNIRFFKTQEGYLPAYSRNELTDDLHSVFGERTDYQISTFGEMKKIIAHSKKVFPTTKSV